MAKFPATFATSGVNMVRRRSRGILDGYFSKTPSYPGRKKRRHHPKRRSAQPCLPNRVIPDNHHSSFESYLSRPKSAKSQGFGGPIAQLSVYTWASSLRLVFFLIGRSITHLYRLLLKSDYQSFSYRTCRLSDRLGSCWHDLFSTLY